MLQSAAEGVKKVSLFSRFISQRTGLPEFHITIAQAVNAAVAAAKKALEDELTGNQDQLIPDLVSSFEASGESILVNALAKAPAAPTPAQPSQTAPAPSAPETGSTPTPAPTSEPAPVQSAAPEPAPEPSTAPESNTDPGAPSAPTA